MICIKSWYILDPLSYSVDKLLINHYYLLFLLLLLLLLLIQIEINS